MRSGHDISTHEHNTIAQTEIFMRRLITGSLSALLLGGTAVANGPSNFPPASNAGFPPSANSGECYGKVKIPAQYSTHAENVLTADGFTDIKVKPAKFKTRVEKYLTKEASTLR